MKNKSVLTVAIFSFIVFCILSSYLWYLYFHDYEGRVIASNSNMEFLTGVELINTGGINYINAEVDDVDSIIPVYYFSVKNKSDKTYNYTIIIENAEGNDGCSVDTRLLRSELQYELKLDNKIIKSAGLDTLQNNVLDVNTIKGNSTNDYSLKIKLKSNDTDYQNKHFHYIVKMKETE